MGVMLSSVFNRFFGKTEAHVLMVGLDSAGKTTILYRLKLEEIVIATPTIGFNVETIKYKNVLFTVWDVGGQEGIRSLWRNYFKNIKALIFVIDSNDRKRVAEVKRELNNVLQDEALKNAKLLVFANKQDMPNVMSISDLTNDLELNKLHKRKWHIQPTCATLGNGLYEGLDWLSNELSK